MKITRRMFVSAAMGTGIGMTSRVFALPQDGVLTPEMFGAKGDGVTNDTDAFAAMTAAINRRGGGTVDLRRTTYIVGRQLAGVDPNDWAFPPAEIMDFQNLNSALIIRGNGARLRCASGLRYGLFNRETGEIFRHALPYGDTRQVASPYRAMISVKKCSAPFELSDLELDGNLPNLRIGGPFGDTGYQIPAIGLFLADNRSTETVRNLHTHHHAQDGVEISGDDRRSVRSRLLNIVSEYNGRQGLSMVGGRGYDFIGCKFNHTGRSSIGSAPGAGVDIEAEGGKLNRDFTFTDCEFSNNMGCGMVADTGDSAGVTFRRCRFIGTTNWSAWPKKPLFRFEMCTFIGSMVRAYGDVDPARAARFIRCEFLDDPALTPNGVIYGGVNADRPIADLSDAQNVLFDHCRFTLTHRSVLPWSKHAIYRDCVMTQRSPRPSYPRGTFIGHNLIVGAADITFSHVGPGTIQNGKPVPPSSN